MKQFKCNACAKSWYVDDGEANNIIACPFCSTIIRQKGTIDGIDTLGKAIYKTISDCGIDILANKDKISGYLLDIVPSLKKEVRIFSKTFDDDYMAIYRTAFGQNTNKVILTMNRLRRLFIEEEGLSEVWADTICDNCQQAVLYYNGEGLPDIIFAEIMDVTVSVESGKSYIEDKIIPAETKGEKTDVASEAEYVLNVTSPTSHDQDNINELVMNFDDIYKGFVLSLGEPFKKLKKLMYLDHNAIRKYKHLSIPLDVDMLYFNNISVIPEKTIVNCHNVKIICVGTNVQLIEENAFAKFEKLEYLIFLPENRNRRILDKELVSNSKKKKIYCSLKDSSLRSQCTYCRCFDNKYNHFGSEKESVNRMILFCQNYLSNVI